MSELTVEIVADVVAACQAGASEAAEAMSRALDAQISLEVGEATTFDPASPPDGFDGAGLIVLLKFGDVALAAALPESTGILPEWVAAPDPTGESKLSTLAQELGMLLVPETLMADDFAAAQVANLGESLAAGQAAEGAALVPLSVTAGENQGALHVIWPFSKHDAILPGTNTDEAAEETPTASDSPSASESEPPAATAPAAQATPNPSPIGAYPRFAGAFSEGLQLLPPYLRSLLKVEVPLVVKLADKKQSIHDIIGLGPGSIITFEKSCDELLELEIGNLTVATGEAVKVGDKFGLKINSMVLPAERFKKVEPPSRRVN